MKKSRGETKIMEKFYLGLDIGTDSLGISCTDENYSLLRAKGKDCWAVRLFDEGQTAVERRTFRTARRRLERRKYRIKALQELFAPYMTDKLFFLRLNNSQYWIDDKEKRLMGSKYNLFDEQGKTDKEFYKQYPTIFHLRKALQTEKITDLRLYYLGIHHIIKYRGHFLFDGTMEEVRDVRRLFAQLNEACALVYTENIPNFDLSKVDEAKECCLATEKNVREKIARLLQIFGCDAVTKEIITGICGGTISPKKLFIDSYKDEGSFSFKKLTDEEFEAMAMTYNDDFVLLSAMRSIYNYMTFEKLLVGQEDISSAMITLYEKHKSDLKTFKAFVKNNATQEEYNKFFKSTVELNNYANYIGYTRKGGEKKKVSHCKTYEDFLNYSKKYIMSFENSDDKETYNKILQEIENGTFLPKILNADNGLFPHQVNGYELNKIISNMVKNCPETKEIADKILKIFLFRVPYYVGPLTGKNSWAVRKSNEKITPWNFDDVVDKASSNEAFMRRMTKKCTYLIREDVLPKNSIYYQKYNVLNQINKLRINDIIISTEIKQAIFKELCLTKNKVSDKDIKNLLVKKGYCSESEKENIVITGKDGELLATMSSYIQMKKILGDFVDRDIVQDGGVCENIILWHTLNTDKNIVVGLIKKNYASVPEVMKKVKELKALSFKDFGKLSKAFLINLKTVEPSTGEKLSILDLLYAENLNLNELLFAEKYNFQTLIKEYNGDLGQEIGYQDVDLLYVSPAVKRGIFQSLKCVDEYVDALGREPDKIFVEVTRSDELKGNLGRTESRKKRLLNLYKSVEGYKELKEELELKNDMNLRQERLYLYFKQLGRCMYSGEVIDFEQLNTNMYDVDHILPRTYIKDDSLDNKVLVLRSKNAIKSDTYPLPQTLVNDQARNHWEVLKKLGLISDITYKRLIRTEPLDEDDYQDFIARQKTITDQTAKAVIELLQRKYKNTKVVFSKAKNVSDFKQKFDLHKSRETNDLHHARDAYLNIVVGNVYDTCFSTPMSYYRQDGDKWRAYNLKSMFIRNVKGAWNSDNNETLLTVKKMFEKTTMSVTRYAYCNKGAFYDQTVYGKGDTAITASRKANSPLKNVSRYGGYKSQKTSHFSIVESLDKKGRKIKTIEAVPVMVAYQSVKDKEALANYFNTYLSSAKILVPKLKIKQLVKYNGTPCYLAGVTGNNIIVHNGIELFTDNKTDDYVNQLSKLVEMAKNGLMNENAETFIMKTNREGEVKATVDKEQNVALYQSFLDRLDLPIYQGANPIVSYKNTLIKCRDAFNTQTTLNQARVLLQIFKFFRCNAEQSDLSLIGGPSIIGVIRVNKDITNVNFEIISCSPCGLTVRKNRI